MPKMTKVQHKRLTNIEAARQSAIQAIYNSAPNRDTRFRDCLKLAHPGLVAAYEAACRDLIEFESRMIGEGRARRSNTGGFYTN